LFAGKMLDPQPMSKTGRIARLLAIEALQDDGCPKTPSGRLEGWQRRPKSR
jgi:hypothetical protein